MQPFCKYNGIAAKLASPAAKPAVNVEKSKGWRTTARRLSLPRIISVRQHRNDPAQQKSAPSAANRRAYSVLLLKRHVAAAHDWTPA
jgi:hypothetical protein